MSITTAERPPMSGICKSKWEAFDPYLDDPESILHLGASGPDPDGDTIDCLHAHLDERAETVAGVEIDEAKAERACDLGYDVRQQNVEVFTLDERFNCVVAPDVIEHFRNPGLMFDRVAEHLEDGGTFLVNTPNPMTLIYMLGYVKRDTTQGIISPNHTIVTNATSG